MIPLLWTDFWKARSFSLEEKFVWSLLPWRSFDAKMEQQVFVNCCRVLWGGVWSRIIESKFSTGYSVKAKTK